MLYSKKHTQIYRWSSLLINIHTYMDMESAAMAPDPTHKFWHQLGQHIPIEMGHLGTLRLLLEYQRYPKPPGLPTLPRGMEKGNQ